MPEDCDVVIFRQPYFRMEDIGGGKFVELRSVIRDVAIIDLRSKTQGRGVNLPMFFEK